MVSNIRWVYGVVMTLLMVFPAYLHAGGCSSGGCSGASSSAKPTLIVGHISVTVGDRSSLNGYSASVTASDEIEINQGGFWRRADDDTDWDITAGPTYSMTGSDYTKIDFVLRNLNNGLYYFYEATNSEGWPTQTHVRNTTRRKILLQKISRYSSGNDPFVTNTYNSKGLLTQQASDGGGYLVYEYADPCDTSAAIQRFWAGTNLNDYCDQSQGDPTGGRWIDLEYDSDTGMLTNVENGCSSCGGREIHYRYTASQLNQIYDPWQTSYYSPSKYINDPNYDYDPYSDPNCYRPSDYLVSKVMAADPCDTLVSYTYDSQDRLLTQWLGNVSTGQKVLEYVYLDYDLYDASAPNRDTTIERRYVDNTYYRAVVSVYEDSSLVEERTYHGLQSGTTLSGDCSVTTYVDTADTQGRLSQRMTILPKGNKRYRCLSYSINDITTESKRGGYTGTPITIGKNEQRASYQGDGYTMLMLGSEDAFGNETTYSYGSLGNRQVIRRYDPEVTPWDQPACCDLDPLDPCYCGSDPRCEDYQQITDYEYDYRGRMISEERTGGDAEDVYTRYTYDVYGNLEYQFENYDMTRINDPDPNDPNTCDLFTSYTYNIYNQPVTVTSGGVIRKTYYSSSGAVQGEAVVDSSDPNYLISGTRYEYDSNGRLTVKGVVDEDERFLESTFETDIATPASATLTWIRELYEYDDYGRKSRVIADADGDYLVTGYEYNNQSEITKVTYPDGHWKETERDGRGLVSAEILGKGAQDLAETNFTYDLNGNLIKKVDPEGVTENYTYDEYDRLVRTRRGG